MERTRYRLGEFLAGLGIVIALPAFLVWLICGVIGLSRALDEFLTAPIGFKERVTGEIVTVWWVAGVILAVGAGIAWLGGKLLERVEPKSSRTRGSGWSVCFVVGCGKAGSSLCPYCLHYYCNEHRNHEGCGRQ